MKNVRVKVVESCSGGYWWYSIYEGRKQLICQDGYSYKANAIKGAKAMAKRIGIPYDPEIMKQHGC